MFRNKNWIGVFGLAMLIFGMTTFLGDGNGYLPLWVAWLIAPLFWYGGFFVTVLWIVARMVGNDRNPVTQAEPKISVVVELQPKRTFSNFLEHDCDVSSESSKAVLPMCGALAVAVALMLPGLSTIVLG